MAGKVAIKNGRRTRNVLSANFEKISSILGRGKNVEKYLTVFINVPENLKRKKKKFDET